MSVGLGLVGRTLGHVVSLRRVIVTTAPSIVLGFLPQVNVALLLATWGVPSVPIVIAERNLLLQRKIPLVWRVLRYVTYRYASAVTINTELNRKYLEAFVPRGKIWFLPNPVSFPKFEPAEEREKVIVAVGRLTYQKGV